MKVLHIGINAIPNLCIARAFRECGHETVSVDWSNRPATNAAMDQALATGVDLVFMQLQGPDVVDARRVAALRDAGAFVVNWTGDVRHPLPDHYVSMAEHVNVTAFTNMPDVEEMRGMGFDARFLQVGYDELIYKPDGMKAPSPPIVFMGNNYGQRFPLSKERAAMVARMRSEFGRDFAVYGKKWGPGSAILDPFTEAATYRGCKVAINFDHFDRRGFYSDRLLRAMACGCPTLDATRLPVDDIVDLCRSVLEHPYDEMQRMMIAQETHDLDRWHNRIAILEQWTEHNT